MRTRPLFLIRPRAAVSFIALVALAAATACDRGSTAPKTPQLASITIDQRLDTLSELTTRHLTLSGVDTKGQPFTVQDAVWQSSDTTVATVSTSGEVTGVRPGNATISVKSGAVGTSLALRVVAEPVSDVTVHLVGAVASDTLLVGTTATLVTEARDIAGRVLLGRQVNVSAADTTRLSIDANAKVTGRLVGYADVVLRSDSIERRRTIVVRPPFAAKMSLRFLDPKQLGDTTWAGVRDSALVQLTDSAGQLLAASPLRPISFSSDNSAIAQIDPYGTIQFLAAGTATIRATGERLTAAKSITVVRAPVIAVLPAPDTVRVSPGETTVLRPILVDGGGLRAGSLTGHTLTFESLNPSIATVDAQGNVTGVAVGTTQIRMASDKGTGLAPVQVNAPAGDQAFHITLNFVGPPPAQYVVDAFNAAVKRWQGVIRRTTGTYTDTLNDDIVTKGSCSNRTGTHVQQITDVVIYARIDSIDGPSQILGQAGPCYIKQLANGRYMSTVGEMVFDSADISLMQTKGLLTNVITHEMGHVLGIGTMWGAFYNNNVPLAQGITARSIPTTYSGLGGEAASAGMGFTAFTFGTAGSVVLDRVLLEDTGGPGTAGSHWRRSVYGNELMNGYAGSGPQPLSLLTVLAIADLGYSVNTSAAETWGTYLFATPSFSLGRLPQMLGTPATVIGERLVSPQFATDRAGRRHQIGPAERQ